MAKKNLFGASPPHHYRNYSTSSSPRRAQLIQNRPDGDAERDPLEDELLGALEDLAQKTDTLTIWADELYELVKAVPQSKLLLPFVRCIQSDTFLLCAAEPLPPPARMTRRESSDSKHSKRKTPEEEARYNAQICVTLYILLMSFAQKGIDKLRSYQEHMAMKHPDTDFVASEGFDDALAWFKERFIKCNDRAALVKTWLPPHSEGPKRFTDQLVYERALALVSHSSSQPWGTTLRFSTESDSSSEGTLRAGH
jgi:serine/threonine-protein kinase ULK/ATG1